MQPGSERVHAARPPVLLSAARQLSTWHRWLGTVLCCFFALWFATGFVMIYMPFPSLSEHDRIGASEPVDIKAVSVAPEAALAAAGGAAVERLRLVQSAAGPRYVMALGNGRVVAVEASFATSIAPAPSLTAALARITAERFARRPIKAVEGPFQYDQWVVHQRFDGARPYDKATVDDAAGTELYISATTGEVLQRTTRLQRGWNWVGAVVHWLYPTVLRRNFWAWDQTVWWLSLAGIGTATLGMALGTVRLVNLRRKTGHGLSPFRHWLRWHHVLGLVAGSLVLTWIFSGWLSMDHGRLFSLEVPPAFDGSRLRGMSMPDAVRGITPDRLSGLGDAHELEFTAVAGHPYVLVRGGRWGDSAAIAGARLPDTSGAAALLPDGVLREAVRQAWAPADVASFAPLDDDDAYGHLRNNPLPATTRRAVLSDPGATWVHIDAASGRLISVMDRSRRLYRWLFDGLHTFDFPFLNRAGRLWQVLMLCALAVGLAFSVTGVVLGVRRVGRSGCIRRKPRWL